MTADRSTLSDHFNAADTVVIKEEEIMEKPVDRLDNMRMLAELNENKVNKHTYALVMIVTPF